MESRFSSRGSLQTTTVRRNAALLTFLAAARPEGLTEKIVGELDADDLGRKIIMRVEFLGMIAGVLLQVSPHPHLVSFTIIAVDTRAVPLSIRNDELVMVGW